MNYLFLDTNIYLHFKQFDQIKWSELLNIKDFTIVIPYKVVTELDKHKLNKIDRISKQAKQIIKLLEKYSDKSTSPELVKILFLPNKNYSDIIKNHSLDNSVSDDIIIASILDFKENKNENVILIAYDLGIKLKAKSNNIKTYEPPEDQLIVIDDTLEKRNKELEREIALLKNKIPDLKILFENKETLNKFEIKNYVFDESKIGEKLKELKSNFPYLTEPTENKDSLNYLLNNINKWGLINPNSHYNKNLTKYFNNYEQYLKDYVEYAKLYLRSFPVKLILINEGVVPADDVHISIYFPKDVEILNVDNFPKVPKEPKKPKLSNSQNSFYDNIDLSDILDEAYETKIKSSFNASKIKIVKSDFFQIDTHVERAMHNKMFDLDIFYVVFKNYESAFSFNFSYNIVAENIPKMITGKLNFVVEKK